MRIGTQYVQVMGWRWWHYVWLSHESERRIGIFRNTACNWRGRWGFYILGLEIGSRDPRDPVGLWLHSHGLWRW